MTRSAAHSTLPPLSCEQAAHSELARAHIFQQIEAAGGWMSFARFMDLALYSPGIGYYSAGSVKLGRDGDFITAPEMSDLFSHCVARQCAQVLSASGGSILELGAGSGRMAAAILESLLRLDCLPERYYILEVSADLAQRQRERVESLPSALRARVEWLDRLPQTLLHGVVLANEVLDALPVHRFLVRASRPYELGVALSGRSLVWTPASQEFRPAAPLLQSLPHPLPDGYRSELSLAVTPWIAAVAGILERGAVLLFDYGLPRSHYYHPQRLDGTLRCHFQQRAHEDPFINIGVQDITAWVDFTAVAEAALAADLRVEGFATQAAFLLGTGIESAVATDDLITRTRLAGEARRLLLPGEMGEAFKVMALTRAVELPLLGFIHQDLRASL